MSGIINSKNTHKNGIPFCAASACSIGFAVTARAAVISNRPTDRTMFLYLSKLNICATEITVA